MSLANLQGGFYCPVGPSLIANHTAAPGTLTVTMDAANEAMIFIGRIIWSDLGSHTIDTSGSSSIQWRTAACTFANAGTTLKVGLAAVDTSTGPAGRAVNVADVITFDVAAVLTGGGGGVTTNAWQTSVPTTGTKTVGNGDKIAMAVQMTARGGADSVIGTLSSLNGTVQEPNVTSFTGGAYAAETGTPIAILVASDGTIGWFFGTDVFSTVTNRSVNSGSSPNEYGQLYQLPFPCKIFGLYGWGNAAADYDVILYSDPLGTPVAEKTISLDFNTLAGGAGRRWEVMFAAAYSATASQVLAAIMKPTSVTNISTYYKTLDNAAHRAADIGGTSSYGVSRSGGSGAFANANSSLDHYRIGFLISAFDDGAGGGSAGVIGHPGLSGGMLS